jgi:hypothetical protein
MKRIYLILPLFVVVLASCSTYKNSQNPENGGYSGGGGSNNGEYYSTPNDQYVHMLVSNPARWSYFDDYNYDYSGAYGASCFSSFGNFMYGYTPWMGGFSYWSPMTYWNSYYTWNSFYNPYYSAVVIVNPKSAGTSPAPYTHVETFAPYSYNNNVNNIYRPANLPVTKGLSAPYSYSQTIRSSYENRGYYPNGSQYGHNSSGYGSQGVRGYNSPATYSNNPGSLRMGGSGFSTHSMSMGGGGHR